MSNNIHFEILFQKLTPEAIIPKRETEFSAGMDFSCLTDVVIEPHETKKVKTGLAAQIPRNTFLMLVPRSGLASKTPYLIKNTPGTIDADYRGEIMILVHNLGYTKENLVFSQGERICQGILLPALYPGVREVQSLDDTERGSGGFGHTGT